MAPAYTGILFSAWSGVCVANKWSCSAAQPMSRSMGMRPRLGFAPKTVWLRLLTWSGAAQRCSQP